MIAVIGGTGLYSMPGLEHIESQHVNTPWGEPSANIVTGDLAGRRLAFLCRHGEEHSIAPHLVNYRANLWALHTLGASVVIGINAVGGISARMAPRVLAVPDQLIDYTWGRAGSFEPAGPVQHIEFAEPYDAGLRSALLDAAERSGVAVVDGGCYGATQGPRLETRAEIARLSRDQCELVGMTGMPEAALARELGQRYACLAVVANWAAGCGPIEAESEAAISMQEVVANVAEASAALPKILADLQLTEC